MNIKASEGRGHVSASFFENFGNDNTGTFSATEFLLPSQRLRRYGLPLAAKRIPPRLSALYGMVFVERLRRNGLPLAAKRILPRLSALYGMVFVERLRRNGLPLAAKRIQPRLSALYGLLFVERLRAETACNWRRSGYCRAFGACGI